MHVPETSTIPGFGGGGQPLVPAVREAVERSLGVDAGSVRVHADDHAHQLADTLSARAVTYGPHIFLGAGEQPGDLVLMSHEVAHAVQQQGARRPQAWSGRSSDSYEREAHRASTAVVRGEPFVVRERTDRQRPQRLGLSDALDYFADRANLIPGFRMFTIVLGVNPINMSRVDRSAANIMRAVIEFIPGGALITQALDTYGIFDRVGGWVDEQIRTLGMTGSVIRRAIDNFLDSLSWTDIFDLGGLWERARRIFTSPITRIIDFVAGLVGGILRFIKDAILIPLARLAEGTRGYGLLKAVLGQDPITGEPVPRNAETLIGGFMRLIGQEEVWQNLQRANAVARAWAWFQGALAGLMGFVRQIPQLFISALQSLQIADLVLVPRAFARIGSVFGGFIVRFLSWAGEHVMSLLEIIFAVVAPAVMPYVRRAAGAFRTIVENPIRFIGHLVRAGIQGLRQFASNFLTHLRTSLIQWLTGAMSGASIYIPQEFTLREVIKFVLSVLGLTWQNIRTKLVRAIGETAVTALETTFDIVLTLVREGPAAAWDKIREQITNLREMVMEQVMTFVRDRIITAAITRLVTSLNPAGAFIQAIIAIYNTVMFFIERMRQIIQVAMAFIDSIAAIASGNISAAASRVETVMAGLLTLVISFLARIVGLGRVSDAVINIVNRIRQPIDRALDRVIEWIVNMARRAGRMVMSAGRRLVEWWRQRREFRSSDGQQHAIYFSDAHRLTVSSVPKSVADLLREIRRAKAPNVPVQVANAERLLGEIDDLVARHTGPQNPASRETSTIAAQIEAKLALLAAELVPLLGPSDLPLTAITYGMASGLAHTATAMPLTNRAGNTSPSQSTTAPVLSDSYQTAMNRTRQLWDKLHLISYKLMGPNAAWNLVAGDRSANGNMETLETSIEQKINSSPPSSPSVPDERIRWYATTVTFWPTDSAVPHHHLFLRSVTVVEGRFDPTTRAKQELTHGPWNSQEPPAQVTSIVVNFSSSGHEVISTTLDPGTGQPLGNTAGQAVVDARRLLAEATGGRTAGRRQFSNPQEFFTYLRAAHLGAARANRLLELLQQYPSQFRLS